ncbi:MAG: hypothetical protein JXR36_02710 [Bacteroidales bacterium]|nr:hypothetical protein [Bacteroidales bacterium]
MAKKYIDQQLTGMAGEFLTVGKLFKLGLQASVTFGNAKAIDVLAYNPENNKSYAVQVKTLRKKNCFLLKKENINPDHIFVFIFLNDFEQDETFYIIEGKVILQNIEKFYGSSYRNPEKPSKMPAINYGSLKGFEDNWGVFE